MLKSEPSTVLGLERVEMKVREMTQVIFRADPDVKAWLERKALQEDRSQNWLVGKVLREAMQRDEQIKQA